MGLKEQVNLLHIVFKETIRYALKNFLLTKESKLIHICVCISIYFTMGKNNWVWVKITPTLEVDSIFFSPLCIVQDKSPIRHQSRLEWWHEIQWYKWFLPAFSLAVPGWLSHAVPSAS